MFYEKSRCLSINELKDTFFLKKKKRTGVINVLKNCLGELHYSLRYLFGIWLITGVFSYNLQIAQVTPFFKAGELENVSNYSPIFAFPFFSKILERIMCNRLYKYLIEEKILHQK